MERVSYHNTISDAISLIEASYTQFAFSRHYHLDFHIGLITHGEQKFNHNGKTNHVGHGQIVIMQPDELHDGKSTLEAGYQTRVFAIDPAWFQQLTDLQHPTHSLAFKQSIVSNTALFNHLKQTHCRLSTSHISQLEKDCLPFDGLYQLLEQFSTTKSISNYSLGVQSIHTLKEYLLEHLDQPVRLEQLSNLCHLSPTQFQRHFKNQMHITPYAWLYRLRLEQAMKLLQSGLSSTDVAYRVGFYDQAHFAKAFKQTYGVPPSQIIG